MICFPTAKINLGLRVTARRPDGFHTIETVFYPIGLKDALDMVPAPETASYSLTVTGTQDVIEQEANLVTKAYRLLASIRPLPPLDVHLHKAIPSGAGLGGGSSDAAFMLDLLNDNLQLGFSKERLLELAVQLGADCPFFLINKPLYATGTGSTFSECPLSLSGYHLVVVKPSVSIPTAAAYKAIKPEIPAISVKDLVQTPVRDWKDNLVNDFESYAFSQYPIIGNIKQRLYQEGALYASMTGSGSAVYGLFEKAVDLSSAFESMFYWSEQL
jgi:4-diphosphocytidyl-2-C-methyl-D-erythritol kinase